MATPMRKRFGAKLKTDVALEALRGEKTIASIASEFKVHPSQVSSWKKQLQKNIPQVFGAKPPREGLSETREAELFEEIGRLKFELEWLKKKAAKLA